MKPHITQETPSNDEKLNNMKASETAVTNKMMEQPTGSIPAGQMKENKTFASKLKSFKKNVRRFVRKAMLVSYIIVMTILFLPVLVCCPASMG